VSTIDHQWYNYKSIPDRVQRYFSNIAVALKFFFDDVGVLAVLICDLASAEQTGKNTDMMELARRLNIKLHSAKNGRGVTQRRKAEIGIREIKTKWKVCMWEAQILSQLWDYGLVYIAEVQSLLACGPLQRSGLELISGQTPDILEWLDFDFNDQVWYWDQKTMDMGEEQARLG
jgi:hypothetical protein